MEQLLNILIILPFAGFLITILIPKTNEFLLSRTAFFIAIIQWIASIFFVIYWITQGANDINIKDITLMKTAHYEFFIDLYFDRVGAFFMLIGGFLTFLVTTYSRYYLHREKGYKRFFTTTLLFYSGFCLTVLSGNYETLFIGWEVLGISSFLLIAFYRDRNLPVLNAFKVFSYYRIADMGLLLSMWASHHLWHENITFAKLHQSVLVSEHLASHSWIGVFISLGILLAACVKSAQLPFSSWLPRAMEGPTPSSAIFYGSLSVHLGVFLLLRTFPFWEHQLSIRILIFVLGILTAISTSLIGRTQSSVKAQIAYSSIAQIGLIFVEISLGLELLALIHFAGNAFLRTYQLLISPSIVSYKIKEQFYTYVPRIHTFEDSLPKKIEYSLYVLSVKEFNLENFMNLIFWKPIKKLGKLINFIKFKNSFAFFVPLYVLGLVLYFYKSSIPLELLHLIPNFFAFFGMLVVFKSYSERENPYFAWLLITSSHFWLVLAVLFNENLQFIEVLLYLGGVSISSLFGFIMLYFLHKKEKMFNLNEYLGHSFEHPKFALLFLICVLGITGFPITTTFIGEDLIFSHIHKNQLFLAFFASQIFVFAGLSAIRIYSRLFLGIHCKSYHELPYKNS